MNIGFDLDEIFVSHPPLIPASLIAFLYRGKQEKSLHYRIPGNLEKKFRILTHHPLFRPILKENLSFVQNLSLQKGYKLYLISSRFSFLKDRTDAFIKQNGFTKMFDSIHFNFNDKQPHEFKSEILNRIHLDKYVDDDLPLLKYLAQMHPSTSFYWLNPQSNSKLTKNFFAITNIKQIL